MTKMAKEKQTVMVNAPMIDSDPKREGQDISSFERDLILLYLRNKDKINKFLPVLNSDIKIKTLNNNFFYNSYVITFGNSVTNYHQYVLKLSLDQENEKLKRESVVLKSVDDKVSPSFIDYTYFEDRKFEFLLTSWEDGRNFEYYGDDDFMYNIGTFSSVLDVIHETDTKNVQSFKERFEENESILSTSDVIDPNEIKIFEKLTDLTFEDLESIFLKIKQDFLPQYVEDIPVLCHSNLKHSNILYRSQFIKVINFENSHVSDIYYSLLKCVNNTYMYYSEKKTKKFLNRYHQFSILLGDMKFRTFQKTYESKKELNRVLLFQDLLCKTVLHFFTYGPFSRKKSLNHYMNLYMNLKPTILKFFPDYIDSLDKLFFTAAPNIKTYDINELKSLIQ